MASTAIVAGHWHEGLGPMALTIGEYLTGFSSQRQGGYFAGYLNQAIVPLSFIPLSHSLPPLPHPLSPTSARLLKPGVSTRQSTLTGVLALHYTCRLHHRPIQLHPLEALQAWLSLTMVIKGESVDAGRRWTTNSDSQSCFAQTVKVGLSSATHASQDSPGLSPQSSARG